MKFPWCFKKDSRALQKSVESISRVFQESFKGVSTNIEGVPSILSMVFQEVSKKFQGSFKSVLRKF